MCDFTCQDLIATSTMLLDLTWFGNVLYCKDHSDLSDLDRLGEPKSKSRRMHVAPTPSNRFGSRPRKSAVAWHGLTWPDVCPKSTEIHGILCGTAICCVVSARLSANCQHTNPWTPGTPCVELHFCAYLRRCQNMPKSPLEHFWTMS